ncbi:gp53-like domain-containing protein [Chromobacterium alticapitis]|uniref:Uncharacterized protein n=1 Tax=Chromobacterium alticapitis TaxID=2073169 RepID=A0A2S5DAZ1_9NEIS|nr:interleukin-like EMT inducer domain-containing protein [Chromobacterium alticapitis]POZ60161.1 hypothetical protein C2I19_20260 [Chromobacterium alticapitis]
MANLQEKPVWETGIYQLETTDPVLGGADGVDNLQAKQLANRTTFLKKQIDDMVAGALIAEYADRLKTPRNIAMTGDGGWNVTFDAGGDVSAQMTLKDSGVAAGSYGQVTVDSKGRVTAARAIQPGDVPPLDWGKIASGKPTTLAGYGIADGLTIRPQLGDKVDLNTITDDGLYHNPGNAYAANGANYPAPHAGLLFVFSDDNMVYQRYQCYDDAGCWYRCRYRGNWQAWRRHADASTTLAGYGITDAASKTDLASGLDASRTLRNVEYLKATSTSGAAGRIAGINASNQLFIGDIDGVANLLSLQVAGVAVASATKDGLQLNGAPTVPTPAANAGGQQAANVAYVKSAIDGVVAGAPGALNTLKELADALGSDGNFAATVTNKLATKADKATTLAGYGIADAASAGDLAKVAAKVNNRRLICVRAGGYSATNGSAGVEIDGVTVGSAARSYNMLQLDVNGSVSRSATFDVSGGVDQGKAAANWLNAAPNSAVVIVYTWDEPQGNRLSGGLPEALYRCGASSAVFASDQFQYRSAYLLIGKAGCGEGQGLERYRGDKGNSPDAQLEVSFELVGGQFMLVGAQGSDQNCVATVTNKLDGKADKATTLAGYGIADAASINGNSSKTFNVANATAAAHAVALGQFGSSLAQNGYQYLPNGLLLQWGKSGVIAGASSVTEKFPIAFPNGVFSMTASSYLDTNNSETFNVFIVSNSQYRVTSGFAAAVAAPVCWIAIGY